VRPSKLRAGDSVMYTTFGGVERRAVFVSREPARGKFRPAVNVLRFPDFAGQDGPDDNGICTVSDYEFSRRARYE
jgi:hypothetical protein